MAKILIITGGNKGIGSGIVEAYLKNQYKVFSIARGKNMQANFSKVKQIQYDLSNSKGIEKPIAQIFESLKSAKIERIVLINNAGTLGQIGKIEEINNIAQTVQLNTIAPLMLSSAFIHFTKSWSCTKKIINISSGAAHKPYYGWTVYCATKAAIDMMTRTIAVEQSHVENGAQIIAIYPGVVDTEMQGEIRKSNKADFIAIDRFLDLKATGNLADVNIVGQQIFNIDHRNDITSGSLVHIEDYH